MRNGIDFWCFSVVGRPLSKKRSRIVTRYSRFTQNEWYERMIGDAFKRAFPKMKPIGYEFYDKFNRKNKKGKTEIIYKLKKGYTKSDVPCVRPYMFFYFESGNIGDADNYVKIVQDGLNKIAYIDDFQIRVPTPHIIINPDEIERVDILLVPYNQDNDDHLLRLSQFVNEHSVVMDLYDEYEEDRLRELTMDQLGQRLCPNDCKYYETCQPKCKNDIIFCENRLK